MSIPSTGLAIGDELENSRLALQALEPLANARGADGEWHELSLRLGRLRRWSSGGLRDIELRVAIKEFVEDAENLVDRVIG